MHARELIELAALVSTHGPLLIQSGEPIPADGVEQYWTGSKVRLDRWTRNLKQFARLLESDADAGQRENLWPAVRGTFEEILTGEILTRVWTAVLCAYDRSRGTDEVEPVARSVMLGHTEARHRALTLLMRGTGIETNESVRLNRLRRRSERWTDLLVSRLAGVHNVEEFAADPVRSRDFAQDQAGRRGVQENRLAGPLLQASLREAFEHDLDDESPNADLNAQIAGGILTCFPPGLFDSTGLFRSMWLARLTNMAEDAQAMIEELLGPAPPETLGRRFGRRCV